MTEFQEEDILSCHARRICNVSGIMAKAISEAFKSVKADLDQTSRLRPLHHYRFHKGCNNTVCVDQVMWCLQLLAQYSGELQIKYYALI